MSLVRSNAEYLPRSCLPSQVSFNENWAVLSLSFRSHFHVPVGSGGAAFLESASLANAAVTMAGSSNSALHRVARVLFIEVSLRKEEAWHQEQVARKFHNTTSR